MKIAIIGGSGKMGRWFADFLVKEGREVIISGRNQRKLLEAKQQLGNVEVATNVEAVKRAEVIVISTPIDGFEDVIKQICPQRKAFRAPLLFVSLLPKHSMKFMTWDLLLKESWNLHISER